MKLRWSFRAANDRGPQAESRVLFEAPNKEATHHGDFFIFHLIYMILICVSVIQQT